MRRNRARAVSALVALAGCLACGAPLLSTEPARADQTGDMLRAAVDKAGPTIVSLRAVNSVTVKAGGQTRDFDVTVDFKGVVVSADGLVMCSNSYLSGERFKDALPPGADDIQLNPREIRITVGNEATEYYGSLAAQDSTVGLAFVQIRDLKGRTLPFTDFAAAQSATVNVGDPTASVTRLGKNNDYAPVVVDDRIASSVTKPRKAYVPEGVAGGFGLPVFGPSGDVIGVVTVLPLTDTSAEAGQTALLSARFQDAMNEPRTQFIIPTSAIAPLITLAKTRAASLPAFVVPTPKPPTTAPKPTATPAPTSPAPATKPPTTTPPPVKH